MTNAEIKVLAFQVWEATRRPEQLPSGCPSLEHIEAALHTAYLAGLEQAAHKLNILSYKAPASTTGAAIVRWFETAIDDIRAEAKGEL